MTMQCMVDSGCVMMVISSCIVIPSTMGYVGAVRENRVVLAMYFTPILALWVIQLVFIILLPVGKTILYSAVGWAGTWSLDHYRGEKEEQNLLTWVWNTGMAGLQCCGVQGYADFTNTTWWQRGRLSMQILPSACCILDMAAYPVSVSPQDSHCITVPTSYNSYWVQGCLPRLSGLISQHTSLVILFIISLLTLEIVVIILAVCLCMLQRTRTDKTKHRTVIVREGTGRHSHSQQCQP